MALLKLFVKKTFISAILLSFHDIYDHSSANVLILQLIHKNFDDLVRVLNYNRNHTRKEL